MDLDLTELSPAQVYFLMIQTVVPRPVAWVLSDSGEGRHNLAPFSYFNGICSSPPLCMISVGHKKDGSKKDTWRNIEERDDFVLHIGSPEHAGAISATSAGLVHGDSEVDLARLETVPFEGSRLPRVVGPRVAYACRRHRILELGDGPQGVIFGELRAVWIDDAIVDAGAERLKIDPMKLDPISRLGGDDYGRLGEVFTVSRPGAQGPGNPAGGLVR